MKAVAEAVHVVHEQGAEHSALVHRDLKPANILLDRNGDPHVADFGLAAPVEQLHKRQAGAGGTIRYMSPEQVRAYKGEPDTPPGRRSDIWSLGAILFEMVTGLPPFIGTEDEVMNAIQQKDPSWPKDFKVPAALSEIICKCLARNPNERFQTAKELSTQLQRWLRTVAGPAEVRSIPYSPSNVFVGRSNHIARCHELLLLKGRVALSGLGGVGKTQIALAYEQQHQEEYRYSLWVNAASPETLLLDLVGIAHKLKLQEKNDPNQATIVDAVKRWLEEHDGWLLIFDNANDLGMVREYIPRTGHGHVLLTTQAQATVSVAPKVDVLSLDPNDGAFLLLRRAGILDERDSLDNATQKDREAALKIASELGGLPLALDHAGAYIEGTENKLLAT